MSTDKSITIDGQQLKQIQDSIFAVTAQLMEANRLLRWMVEQQATAAGVEAPPKARKV